MKHALHSGKLGDVIYCLPALEHISGKLLLNCVLPRTGEAPLTFQQAAHRTEAGTPAISVESPSCLTPANFATKPILVVG